MKAVIFFYQGDSLTQEDTNRMLNEITNKIKQGSGIECHVLTDKEVAELVIGPLRREIPNLPVKLDNDFANVQEAIAFCIIQFDSPLDNENAFRARFNQRFYKPESKQMRSLMYKTVRALSYANAHLNNPAYAKLIGETGFTNVIRYCKELVMYANVED